MTKTILGLVLSLAIGTVAVAAPQGDADHSAVRLFLCRCLAKEVEVVHRDRHLRLRGCSSERGTKSQGRRSSAHLLNELSSLHNHYRFDGMYVVQVVNARL